jgi:hypothetical protein
MQGLRSSLTVQVAMLHMIAQMRIQSPSNQVGRLAMSTAIPLVLLLVAGAVAAQEPAPRRTEESFIPSYTAASVGYLWGSESDLERLPDASMTLHEASVSAQYPVWMAQRSRLTAGVRYRYTHLLFSGDNPFAAGGLDLHRLQVPVNFWHSFHEQWKLWAGIEPGLFTDFQQVDADDFALTALLVAAYEFHPRWTVSFGGYYSRDLGEDRLLPVLGVIWRPNPHWNVAATFPRFRVAYAPNPMWLFEGMIRPGGAGWNYSHAEAERDLDLEYRSWRASLGMERLLTARLPGSLHGYIEAGLGFSQNLKLKRNDSTLASVDLDESLILAAGLRWRF